jgi:hypothetical protein
MKKNLGKIIFSENFDVWENTSNLMKKFFHYGVYLLIFPYI